MGKLCLTCDRLVGEDEVQKAPFVGALHKGCGDILWDFDTYLSYSPVGVAHIVAQYDQLEVTPEFKKKIGIQWVKWKRSSIPSNGRTLPSHGRGGGSIPSSTTVSSVGEPVSHLPDVEK